MLKWIKKIFGVEKKEPLPLTNPVKYEDEVVVIKRPAKPTPTKTSKPKKSTAKKETAKAGTKRGRKKTGVTKTDIQKMNKVQLEAYAKKEFKVDIDRRRKREDLLAEVLKLAGK